MTQAIEAHMKRLMATPPRTFCVIWEDEEGINSASYPGSISLRYGMVSIIKKYLKRAMS